MMRGAATAWFIIGGAMLLLAIMLAVTPVSIDAGSCGTLVAKRVPENPTGFSLTGYADDCNDAFIPVTWGMALAAVAGFAILGVVAALVDATPPPRSATRAVDGSDDDPSDPDETDDEVDAP